MPHDETLSRGLPEEIKVLSTWPPVGMTRQEREEVLKRIRAGVKDGKLTREDLLFYLGCTVAFVEDAHAREDSIRARYPEAREERPARDELGRMSGIGYTEYALAVVEAIDANTKAMREELHLIASVIEYHKGA